MIEQTEAGLVDADSYVGTKEFNDYLLKRGITLTGDAGVLLIKAMDYLEAEEYKSTPINPKQSTAFPRIGFGIPKAIKTAQMQLAIIADTAELMPNVLPTDKVVVSEKLDVLQVNYQVVDPLTKPKFTYVEKLLEPYLAKSQKQGFNIAVNRG